MNGSSNIMVVEDDIAAGKILSFNLKAKGYNAKWFQNAEEALLYFKNNPVDLILVDYMLPGMTGEEFYIRLKELNPLTPVIFMTAIQSVDKAVQLLKMGAYTYLTKPLKMEEVLHNVSNVLEKINLVKENQRLQDQLQETFSYKNYIFNTEKMQQILRMVMRVAGSSSNVLITGESGTGKDVIANIIHFCSKRKDEKFVKVNLASIPDTLIEAELFGAAKGAYTGSVENRSGKFEEADKGTLFLDEIGELAMPIQVKLLRTLQEREVTRLGTHKTIQVDIRLITATNKNLSELIKENKFREDLYYRLNVINIELPPLRERKEDIPMLIDWFIKKYNEREKKNIKTVSAEALNILMKYHFPGNIRELENIIERAMVLCQSDILGKNDLPAFTFNNNKDDSNATIPDVENLPLPDKLEAIERTILIETLQRHNYNQSRAAEELGISESRLRYKIKTLHIDKE